MEGLDRFSAMQGYMQEVSVRQHELRAQEASGPTPTVPTPSTPAGSAPATPTSAAVDTPTSALSASSQEPVALATTLAATVLVTPAEQGKDVEDVSEKLAALPSPQRSRGP